MFIYGDASDVANNANNNNCIMLDFDLNIGFNIYFQFYVIHFIKYLIYLKSMLKEEVMKMVLKLNQFHHFLIISLLNHFALHYFILQHQNFVYFHLFTNYCHYY